MNKVCKQCSKEKELSEFYLRVTLKPYAECKECYKANRAVYVKANRMHVRKLDVKAQANKRARIKEAVFAAYGGYVCACCGESERKFLTLDHINNDGAAFRMKIAGKRAASGYTTYVWLARNSFPSGYQVLCMNCNYGKQMNKGVCPHKTRCNDYPQGVGAIAPKRSTPVLTLVRDEDIVSSTVKAVAGEKK